jgi:hypothetical protein
MSVIRKGPPGRHTPFMANASSPPSASSISTVEAVGELRCMSQKTTTFLALDIMALCGEFRHRCVFKRLKASNHVEICPRPSAPSRYPIVSIPQPL